MLAIVRAGGRADVHQLALELGEVALHQCETEPEGLLGLRRATERETVGDALAGLVHLHVACHGLAQSQGEERDEEQAASSNHDGSRWLLGGERDLGGPLSMLSSLYTSSGGHLAYIAR